jgi:hypothetical protein
MNNNGVVLNRRSHGVVSDTETVIMENLSLTASNSNNSNSNNNSNGTLNHDDHDTSNCNDNSNNNNTSSSSSSSSKNHTELSSINHHNDDNHNNNNNTTTNSNRPLPCGSGAGDGSAELPTEDQNGNLPNNNHNTASHGGYSSDNLGINHHHNNNHHFGPYFYPPHYHQFLLQHQHHQNQNQHDQFPQNNPPPQQQEQQYSTFSSWHQQPPTAATSPPGSSMFPLQQQQQPQQPPQQQQQQVLQHPLSLPPGHAGLLQYYEAQMRDHAAAYANAAAAAAVAAAQIATAATSAAAAAVSPTTGSNGNHHADNGMMMMMNMTMMPSSSSSCGPHYHHHHHHHPLPPLLPEPPTFAHYQESSSSSLPFHQLSLSPLPNHQPTYREWNHHSHFNKKGEENNNDDDEEEEEEEGINNQNINNNTYRRRKRQPRADDHTGRGTNHHHYRRRNNNNNNNHNHHNYHQDGRIEDHSDTMTDQQRGHRRRRRFWNDSASGDSDPVSQQPKQQLQQQQPHQQQQLQHQQDGFINNSKKRINPGNRRRNRKAAMPPTASSSSDGGSATWTTKKKQKHLSDEHYYLLGKTASGALYEWCDKRQITPMFECTVMLLPPPGHTHDLDQNKATPKQGDNDVEQTTLEQPGGGFTPNCRGGVFDQKWYEMSVIIDGITMGKGRGATKSSAKHDASRNALQVLLPGVHFDVQSGIVVQIPAESQRASTSRLDQWSAAASRVRPSRSTLSSTTTSSCLDELPFNLAKRLAIGHPQEDTDDDDDDNNNDCHSSSKTDHCHLAPLPTKRRGKWPYVYPGTSTTSDDEDDNTYLASRDASVCSSLLHAMVQIDDRLSDPPEYSYHVATLAEASNQNKGGTSHIKRKAGIPIDSSSTSFPRGAFQCTGILKIRVITMDATITDSTSNETVRPRESFQLLQAVGSGATKRDARHMAAAKLLAMLFPECQGIAQVKDAAEAAREKYAASRALKQHSRQNCERLLPLHSSHHNRSQKNPEDSSSPSYNLALLASPRAPPIPTSIEMGLVSMVFRNLDDHAGTNNDDDDDDDNNNNKKSLLLNEATVVSDQSGHMRQVSRTQQLEDKVVATLQMLNEHDEEGRSLPDEVTVDDVGRTVLRRASIDDIVWIEELFGSQYKMAKLASPNPLHVLGVDKQASSKGLRLWSSSTIVLLLCRAIAPHEDPPLGCAVLYLGFSMQRGKVLRLAQIASQSHLPRERFVECLTSFATCMGCFLDTSQMLEPQFVSLRGDAIRQILCSHLPTLANALERREKARQEKTARLYRKASRPLEDALVQSALQSVQEEEGEGGEESDASQKLKKKNGQDNKPSKRSRVV